VVNRVGQSLPGDSFWQPLISLTLYVFKGFLHGLFPCQ
jgi:hypothetical protein